MASPANDSDRQVERALNTHRRRFAVLCAIFVALTVSVVSTSVLAIISIDVGRAYVTGEGQYSKAQKSALIRLQQFVYTGDLARYGEFREFLKVPLGDRQAREALDRPVPDYAAARLGFLAGNIPAPDIFRMSLAYVYLKQWAPIARAADTWRKADECIAALLNLGETVRTEIGEKHNTDAAPALTREISTIDRQLTSLESEFGANIRDVEGLILRFAIESLVVASLVFLALGSLRIWQISFKTAETEIAIWRSNDELARAKSVAEKADRLKSSFLASMSHELRTPLNAVIGFSELMKNEVLGPIANEKYRDYAGDIHDAGSHLLSLINDILDLSRIEAGKLSLVLEPVPLGDLVSEVEALCRDRAKHGHVRLEPRLPKEDSTIIADRLRMRQILINLVTNAIKFSNPGEAVEIWAGRRDDGSFEISVRDTGIGMTPEGIEVALTPFGQVDHGLNRKYEGSGLGLPITMRLAEMHGAAFAVKSELNCGTTVSIVFPAERVQSAVGTAVETAKIEFAQFEPLRA